MVTVFPVLSRLNREKCAEIPSFGRRTESVVRPIQDRAAPILEQPLGLKDRDCHVGYDRRSSG
jgi:hypothetical protein